MKKFKKLGAAILAGALVLSMGTGVLAKGPAPKEKPVEVALSVTSEQEFEVIYVGDEVKLQAVTPKHGSSYKDGWVVINENGKEVALEKEEDFETLLIEVEGVNSYVSTAKFEAQEAGTYTLKYSIDMAAGKSHVTFSGNEKSDEIVVKDQEAAYITGVKVENYEVTQQRQGVNYRAAGDIYFTMSEGENQFAQSFSNVVLNNGNSYTNTVEVEAEGQTYIITVTKKGWSLN
ncbi:hypothetical protein ACFPU1_06620 [Thalassorhabdus alkalitolerans]|uniref:Uncharacterized protein n=1 Tax=Thalassorhabdus alkalitolerans TaxID=2282697 RepID=A0ABW0YMS9_9BACI